MWRYSVATLALFISALIAWGAWRRNQELSKTLHPVRKKVWEHICILSAGLALVLLFYHVLIGILASGWQWISVHDLQRMEAALLRLKEVFERYKPSWMTWLLWSATLYFTSAMWIRFLEKDTPFEFTKLIKLSLQIINTAIFFLAAFTVLGFQVGPAATALDIHLQRIRSDFGLLQTDLADALTGSTLNQIYHNVADEFPEAAMVGDLIDLAHVEGARLQEKARQILPERRSPGTALARTLQRIELRERPLNDLSRAPAYAGDSNRYWRVPIPEETTYRQTLRVREYVRTYLERVRPQLIRFVQNPGGKELLLEIPKGAIDNLAKALDPIAETHPMLKPAIEVLKTASNEALKVRFKAKLETLVAETMRNPTRVDQSVSKAVTEVVNEARIDVSPKLKEQHKREIANLRAEINQIRQYIATVESPQPRRYRLPQGEPDTTPAERPLRAAKREPERPAPFRPREPLGSREPPLDPGPSSGGGGGSGGFSTSTTGCICKSYRNGVLVSETTIAVGARCGPYVCGRDIPVR